MHEHGLDCHFSLDYFPDSGIEAVGILTTATQVSVTLMNLTLITRGPWSNIYTDDTSKLIFLFVTILRAQMVEMGKYLHI